MTVYSALAGVSLGTDPPDNAPVHRWWCQLVPASQTPPRSRQRVQSPLLLGLRTLQLPAPAAVVPDTGEVTADTRLANIGTIGYMSPASHGLGGGLQTVNMGGIIISNSI